MQLQHIANQSMDAIEGVPDGTSVNAGDGRFPATVVCAWSSGCGASLKPLRRNVATKRGGTQAPRHPGTQAGLNAAPRLTQNSMANSPIRGQKERKPCE